MSGANFGFKRVHAEAGQRQPNFCTKRYRVQSLGWDQSMTPSG